MVICCFTFKIQLIFLYFAFSNGSGKSSMLKAILHVLQPKSRAQLKDSGVIHEEGADSSRARMLSAVVEILINNQSQQLAFEAEKVIQLTVTR